MAATPSGVQVYYDPGPIQTAINEINAIYQASIHNHDESRKLVEANAAHFGGQGQTQFMDAIHMVNNAYETTYGDIRAAGRAAHDALELALSADHKMAGQY